MTVALKREPRPTLGRYDRDGRERALASRGLPPRSSRNAFTAVAAVPNPLDPRERILGTVNRRVDVLEFERSCGRIDEAVYRLGRSIQRTYELGSRVVGSAWSDARTGDPVERSKAAVAQRYEIAEQVAQMEAEMAKVIGATGVRFVRAILTGEATFGCWAAARGKGGQRGPKDVAGHWRILMANLVEEWPARGRVVAPD